MRVFFAFFTVFVFVVGCGADNPTQSGPSGAPSRIALDTDDPDGDTAADVDLLMPTRFENPLSSFNFNTIDGGRDLQPDEVLDPDGRTEVVPSDPDDGDTGDGGDGLEPEVVPEVDDDDDGTDTDSDDDLEPEVDDDPDSGDDVDDFGIEVIE